MLNKALILLLLFILIIGIDSGFQLYDINKPIVIPKFSTTTFPPLTRRPPTRPTNLWGKPFRSKVPVIRNKYGTNFTNFANKKKFEIKTTKFKLIHIDMLSLQSNGSPIDCSFAHGAIWSYTVFVWESIAKWHDGNRRSSSDQIAPHQCVSICDRWMYSKDLQLQKQRIYDSLFSVLKFVNICFIYFERN